jgi:hypothetical protein
VGPQSTMILSSIYRLTHLHRSATVNMASLCLKILLVSRAICSIVFLCWLGTTAGSGRVCTVTFAALAIVFSIVDSTLLVRYNYLNNNILGKTRSTGGTIVTMTSLIMSSLALVLSALILRLEEDSDPYDIFRYPNILWVVWTAQLGFHGVTFSFIFVRYLRLFCIPGPKRLPRDYKPFDRASSISEMGEGNGSSSDGPLTAIFLEQEEYRRGEPSTQDRNQFGPTHQVCNFTADYLRYDVNCSIKSDAGNINGQSNDNILCSRQGQIFLRPKVV